MELIVFRAAEQRPVEETVSLSADPLLPDRHSPALVEDAAGQHVARTLAALQDEGSFQQEQRVHLPERREPEQMTLLGPSWQPKGLVPPGPSYF